MNSTGNPEPRSWIIGLDSGGADLQGDFRIGDGHDPAPTADFYRAKSRIFQISVIVLYYRENNLYRYFKSRARSVMPGPGSLSRRRSQWQPKSRNKPLQGGAERRQKQIGLWLAMADSYSAEICAGSGFDWLLLDGEHSPLDLRTMLAQLQSVAPYPAHAVVRPPTGDPVIIKQLLDIGAQSCSFRWSRRRSRRKCWCAPRAMPPQGFRGVGAGIARAARWGRVGRLSRTGQRSDLPAACKSKHGLGSKILKPSRAIDGVDGVFLGAADLVRLAGPYWPTATSGSRRGNGKGHRLRFSPSGKAPGLLATDEAVASAYLAQGAHSSRSASTCCCWCRRRRRWRNGSSPAPRRRNRRRLIEGGGRPAPANHSTAILCLRRR